MFEEPRAASTFAELDVAVGDVEADRARCVGGQAGVASGCGTSGGGAGVASGCGTSGGDAGDAGDATDVLERLASMAPGAQLAEVVERFLVCAVTPASGHAAEEDLRALAAAGADVLSELVAACQRLSSWAQWAEAMAAACLARTPDLTHGPAHWGPGGTVSHFVTPEESNFNTTSEIACRLGVSRTRAEHILQRGEALVGKRFSSTGRFQREGLLDEGKVALVFRRLATVPEEIALQVQEEVVPRAPRRTHVQLARDLDRALTRLDPDGASERRSRDTGARHVTRPCPAGVGTHEMRVVMPTMDAFFLDATLDAVAASARAVGDGRALSQLRADALTAMALRTVGVAQHEAHRAGAGDTSPDGAAAVSSTSVAPSATVPASRGVDAIATSPTSAPSARTSSAGTPPAISSASASPRPRAASIGAPPTTQVGGPTASPPQPGALLPDGVPLEGLLSALSGLVGSTSPWWTPSGTQPVPLPHGLMIAVDVTVPLDHLVDLLDDGGSVAPSIVGAHAPTVTIGGRSAPIPAVVARSLAAGGLWRRIVTDPLSGSVLDVGRRRYRPPAALADLVRARDRSCTHPGCDVPARRCDLDHIHPWGSGGTTSLENLTCLCEAHHRLKHTPGWSLRREHDGALSWRTPSGARYRREPNGVITLLPRRVGPRSVIRPGGPVDPVLAGAVTESVLARLERGLSQQEERAHRLREPGSRLREPGGFSLETFGPPPGQWAGAFETVPYPWELHELGLAALLDAVVLF